MRVVWMWGTDTNRVQLFRLGWCENADVIYACGGWVVEPLTDRKTFN